MGNTQNPALDNKGPPTLKNLDWMKELSDDIYINRLTIPGTHDSGTYRGYGGIIAQCQKWSITEQLEAGIRFLDIRCRHYENNFLIHHSFVFEHLTFDDVQKMMINFLKSNASEVIVMRLSDEFKAEKNTRSFEETLEVKMQPYREYYYLYNGKNYPILKDVRGRIILLNDFDAKETKWIIYKALKAQDNYDIAHGQDAKKWEEINNQFIASSKETDLNQWYINYISCSVGNLPFFFCTFIKSTSIKLSKKKQ